MTRALGQDELRSLDLQPAERVTLNDTVYADLRELVISGRLAPGQSLSTRTLAATLGVSPMPVRSALQRLADDGALDGRPNRTYRIPMLSPREFIEILRLRLVLEVAAARQAVPLLPPQSLDRLERIHTEMFGPVPLDLGTFLSLNREFHFILYAAADNTRQLRFIETLWLQIGPLLRLVSNETAGRTGMEPHDDMLKAARARDPGGMAAAMARDIEEAAVGILAWLHAQSPEG
jgi:DNA-binding GntR family transcriptional regulator